MQRRCFNNGVPVCRCGRFASEYVFYGCGSDEDDEDEHNDASDFVGGFFGRDIDELRS